MAFGGEVSPDYFESNHKVLFWRFDFGFVASCDSRFCCCNMSKSALGRVGIVSREIGRASCRERV